MSRSDKSRRAYLDPETKRKVREIHHDQCSYCQVQQQFVPDPLEFEHITPVSKGGSNQVENLCLSCGNCNRHKASKTQGVDPETGQLTDLFNPNTQVWDEHFNWDEESIYLIGCTPTGRATIEALHINKVEFAITARHHWVKAGWHPPKK